MTKLISKRELIRRCEVEGAAATSMHLQECLDAGHLKPENFSIRDLFEALHEDGTELLHSIAFSKSGGRSLMEANNAVDTSAFSSITGQLIFNKIREAFQDPQFLWPELCETIPTSFLNGERIPGVGRLGDGAEIVDEGQPYPTIGLNEEYVDTVPTLKRGFIVPVTREIIVADRTGILVKAASETGYFLGLNKEKRVLDLTTGQVNNYKRNGTATNTYLSSGAYVNSQTGNALDTSGNEWRALEKADLLFDAITDPNTSEPIIIVPDVLLVPSALKRTALRILGATEVATVDNRATASTIRTMSPNPYGGSGIKVLSSPYVKQRDSSATNWFYGAPKKAFAYMQVWDIETLQAANNSELEFTSDIWMRFKVGERGAAQVLEPRFMCQNQP